MDKQIDRMERANEEESLTPPLQDIHQRRLDKSVSLMPTTQDHDDDDTELEEGQISYDKEERNKRGGSVEHLFANKTKSLDVLKAAYNDIEEEQLESRYAKDSKKSKRKKSCTSSPKDKHSKKLHRNSSSSEKRATKRKSSKDEGDSKASDKIEKKKKKEDRSRDSSRSVDHKKTTEKKLKLNDVDENDRKPSKDERDNSLRRDRQKSISKYVIVDTINYVL